MRTSVEYFQQINNIVIYPWCIMLWLVISNLRSNKINLLTNRSVAKHILKYTNMNNRVVSFWYIVGYPFISLLALQARKFLQGSCVDLVVYIAEISYSKTIKLFNNLWHSELLHLVSFLNNNKKPQPNYRELITKQKILYMRIW